MKLRDWRGPTQPITKAEAEAERDRLFDRPAKPMSPALARLFAAVERQQKRRAARSESEG